MDYETEGLGYVIHSIDDFLKILWKEIFRCKNGVYTENLKHPHGIKTVREQDLITYFIFNLLSLVYTRLRVVYLPFLGFSLSLFWMLSPTMPFTS